MNLYLLRHGIPVDPMDWPDSDRTRPLTQPGRAEAKKVIHALAPELRERIQEIWTSPYFRAEATARIAEEILGIPCKVIPALASGARILKALPTSATPPEGLPQGLLVVGHQPDLGNLIADLTSSAFQGPYQVGRAGMALLEGDFRKAGMKLQWLKTAHELLQPHP